MRRATRDLLTYVLKDTPFPCAGTGKFARSRSRKYGYVASYAGETGRLPVRMVSPLSHLGNNGCLLYNYEVNMFAYLYKYVETVYLKGQMNQKIEIFSFVALERFSLDCRKTKNKVNTLANQRA